MIKAILEHKVFKNFSYLTVSNLLSQLLGIFTIIKITQAFSPKHYGEYTFILSQSSLLFVIADLGITNVIIRSIARNRSRTNDLIFNGAIIRCFSVLILSFFYLVYNHYFGSLTPVQLLLVFLFALISCFAHLFEITFLGNEKMLPTSLINLSYSLVWFLIIYSLPAKYVNVNFLFCTYLFLTVLKALASFVFLKRKHMLIGEIQNFWVSSKEILRESWPYFVLVLIMTPVNQLSNNFLQVNSTTTEIGYFNLAQKIISPVSLVLNLALSAIFPNLSALWAKNENRFYDLVSVGFKYFMLTAMMLCFLFTLFAREVITLLFKATYLPAIEVCQLQVWFVFLMSINSSIGTILGAINKEKIILQLGIINTIISTPVLYYASKFGALGLSYGYVISFAIFGIYIWYIFKKFVHIKIKNDLLLWALTVLLFCISHFIPQSISVIYRILPAIVIVGIIAISFFRKIQVAQIK